MEQHPHLAINFMQAVLDSSFHIFLSVGECERDAVSSRDDGHHFAICTLTDKGIQRNHLKGEKKIKESLRLECSIWLESLIHCVMKLVTQFTPMKGFQIQIFCPQNNYIDTYNSFSLCAYTHSQISHKSFYRSNKVVFEVYWYGITSPKCDGKNVFGLNEFGMSSHPIDLFTSQYCRENTWRYFMTIMR